MKIITPGKNYRQRVNGKRISCTKCSGTFEITDEDTLFPTNSATSFTIICPTDSCRNTLDIHVYEPTGYFDR